MKWSLITALASIIALCGTDAGAAAAPALTVGRYIGWIQMDGTAKKFGAIFDTYVVQPNDLTQFPRQDAILKVTLGGLMGHEYETQIYKSVRYDYTNGILSLDGADQDVVITAKVTDDSVTAIDGQVFVRSAGASGTIHLELPSDEPGEGGSGGTLPLDQYAPELSGQYRGRCGAAGYDALVQVETARGLDNSADGETHGLFSYSIKARFGTRDEVACISSQLWCAQRNFSRGSYDFFLKRLTLEANNGTDECDVTETGLDCQVHLFMSRVDHCVFQRDDAPIAPSSFSTRSEYLRTTAAQQAPLPAPNPPANAELIDALRGNFIGNLHNETTGHYQLLRLNVSASSSSDNPHNENLVYVTTNAILNFGPGTQLSRDFWTQQFDPRSFYLAPGFTLESANSDAFMQVKEWKSGYLRGDWYSHAFGRVGTFELVKGTALPAVDAGTPFVPSVAGEFVGPHGDGGQNMDFWTFKLLVPVQQARANVSTLVFKGEYQTTDGAIPRAGIDKGSYDFYSGAISWLTMDERLITGRVKDDSTIDLFWSGVPKWGILMDPDHTQYPYNRRSD